MSNQAQFSSIQKSQPVSSNFPQRVLIVEEDDVNQWLAARLLKQKGYVTRAVTNGEAAVTAVEQEPFDLILMDIQLPLMDGLAATQVIRQRERQTGTRVPIIAFTSETGAAQAQQYWQVGMDSYLAKPIHTDEFYRTIEAVLTLHARRLQPAPRPRSFNCEEALQRLGNDVELLQQLAERFCKSAPHLLSAMRRAIAKVDPYNLDFAAHRLRGTASNLSAHAVVELAARLELIGSVRNMAQAQVTVAALEEELAHFNVAFAEAMQGVTTK